MKIGMNQEEYEKKFKKWVLDRIKNDHYNLDPDDKVNLLEFLFMDGEWIDANGDKIFGWIKLECSEESGLDWEEEFRKTVL